MQLFIAVEEVANERLHCTVILVESDMSRSAIMPASYKDLYVCLFHTKSLFCVRYKTSTSVRCFLRQEIRGTISLPLVL